MSFLDVALVVQRRYTHISLCNSNLLMDNIRKGSNECISRLIGLLYRVIVKVSFSTTLQAHRAITTHELVPKQSKPSASEAFSEYIDNLVNNVKMTYTKLLLDNFFSNKMIINFKMLHPSMIDWVRAKRNRANVVTSN
jgi:hypothetical protein